MNRIIAHRGASHDAPENTLTAMKLAWDQNADAIELLWLSKDGKLMVIHDTDTKRLRGPAQNVTVLASAMSTKESRGSGEHETLLMVIQFGEGRVFHTDLNHNNGKRHSRAKMR